MGGTAVPRDRTASSSSRGPGPLSILRRGAGRDTLTRRQVATKFGSLCNLREDASGCPQESGGQGTGKGTTGGTEGKRTREVLVPVPSPALAPGAPSLPPAERSRRGRRSPERQGLYGTVPSRPPRGPGRRGGGTARLPPPSGRRRRRPRADWPGLRVTSGGLWVRCEQKRC